MPILIMALVALAAFGVIGVMLALAVTSEHKKAHDGTHDAEQMARTEARSAGRSSRLGHVALR